MSLPATVATQSAVVGASEAATTTATASPTTAPTAAPAATTTSAAAVADHLGKARIDLLLGLGKNGDQVTSLLGVCREKKGLDIWAKKWKV